MPKSHIDVSGLWGAVEGYVIAGLESPRASISVLARHFGFDATESEGRVRFVMRGRALALTLVPDAMVAAGETGAKPFELVRGQESEIAQELKWTIARGSRSMPGPGRGNWQSCAAPGSTGSPCSRRSMAADSLRRDRPVRLPCAGASAAGNPAPVHAVAGGRTRFR